MQTFLPYPGFEESAAALDDLRLGKQRVEALQILRALGRPVYGWKSHPAVLMWRGHDEALAAYGLVVCREWTRRGRPDTCEATILADRLELRRAGRPRSQAELEQAGLLPTWLGDDDFHRSHRSALLRKDPHWYGERFDEPADLPYVWPSKAPIGECSRASSSSDGLP